METVETHGNLRAVTQVAKEAVHYSVERYTVVEDKPLDWVVIWKEAVYFNADKTHRPDGYAFKNMARRQEMILFRQQVAEPELKKLAGNYRACNHCDKIADFLYGKIAVCGRCLSTISAYADVKLSALEVL
jgi:hypothetical protein